MGFRTMGLAILLAWSMLGLANTLHLEDLLHSFDAQPPDQIFFMLAQPQSAAISELRMHFLMSEDCYSGYRQGLRIDGKDASFPVALGRLFGLSGRGVYQAAATVLAPDEITQIQGLLIRFVDREHGSRYQQFARFLGSCQDEEINCCIPIRCSLSAGVCIPKYALDVQSITWI